MFSDKLGSEWGIIKLFQRGESLCVGWYEILMFDIWQKQLLIRVIEIHAVVDALITLE